MGMIGPRCVGASVDGVVIGVGVGGVDATESDAGVAARESRA